GADRKTALSWARGTYDRLEADYEGYQAAVRATTGYQASSRTDPAVIITNCKRVLPPKTTWTYYWLLYRYVGLSDAPRAAALEHWGSGFPREGQEEVVAFGTKVMEERREMKEALPPVPEMLPWVCAVERLVGSDTYGARCRAALDREYGLKYFNTLRS